MQLPKDFDDRHWWILMGVAGALIAAASAPVQFVPAFAIGLSLLLFGVGQWIDHPVQTAVGHGWQTTGYPWRPSALGMSLSFAGVVLFGVGLYRLIAS